MEKLEQKGKINVNIRLKGEHNGNNDFRTKRL